MYRINVYNLDKTLKTSREVGEYPSVTEIDKLLDTVGGDCFVDICRSKDDPLEHAIGFTDDLQVDLIEGNSQYA